MTTKRFGSTPDLTWCHFISSTIMKLWSFAAAAAAVGSVSAFNLPQFAQDAIDSGLALAALNGIALVNSATRFGGSCNIANVKVRQEW